MTEEWTKIDKSRYDGTCAGCGNRYAKDDPIYVCGNKYFDSVKCVNMVFTGATEKPRKEGATGGVSSNANKEDKTQVSQTVRVRCPLTQRFHPENEMITVYTRDHEPMRISQLAADLITVQYWAKCEGLWTVPRKMKKDDEPVPEAKA